MLIWNSILQFKGGKMGYSAFFLGQVTIEIKWITF